MSRTKSEYFGKDVRKIVQVGRALAITLPRTYLQTHSLQQGDLVEVYFNKVIYIEPLNLNEVKAKLGRMTQPPAGASAKGSSQSVSHCASVEKDSTS